MGKDTVQTFQDKDKNDRREVIFFGSLDPCCFNISYKLYKCKIQHVFILYEHDPILEIVKIRTIHGHKNIEEYLDSFRYLLDIFKHD